MLAESLQFLETAHAIQCYSPHSRNKHLQNVGKTRYLPQAVGNAHRGSGYCSRAPAMKNADYAALLAKALPCWATLNRAGSFGLGLGHVHDEYGPGVCPKIRWLYLHFGTIVVVFGPVSGQ